MLTFRRHHTETPPWAQAAVCPEYHLSGLELELIDLIDARERAEYGGFDDVAELDAQIAALQEELAEAAGMAAPSAPAA